MLGLVLWCVMACPVQDSDEILLLNNRREVAQVELKKAQAALKSKEKLFSRLEKLVKSNVVTPQVLDELEYDLEVCRLEVRLRELAIERLDIEIRLAKKKN